MAACSPGLGPRSLTQACQVSSSFFRARGRKRQISTRKPSSASRFSSQRLVLIGTVRLREVVSGPMEEIVVGLRQERPFDAGLDDPLVVDELGVACRQLDASEVLVLVEEVFLVDRQRPL